MCAEPTAEHYGREAVLLGKKAAEALSEDTYAHRFSGYYIMFLIGSVRFCASPLRVMQSLKQRPAYPTPTSAISGRWRRLYPSSC
ncbi:hypothetical protein NDU88_001329 [Pleurodeles waltl]|uniref:Uncharacterized protein n=1 Tax=Pleurodeles waltl TaxID=8319 RepID=A0AAV7L9D5_PLEWA|nr:hypothetical protein NDU88_001329 [Pleurodeles waltl]